MRTGIEDPFELRDGTIVGHGLTLEVPKDWVDYEEEPPGVRGRSAPSGGGACE